MKNEIKLWVISLLLLFVTNIGTAQGWEYIYPEMPTGSQGSFLGYAENVFVEDDGYRVYGLLDNEYSILKVDLDGLVTSITPTENYGAIVIQDMQGDFIFGRRAFESPPSEDELVVSKVNEDGNLIWENTYGNPLALEIVDDLIQGSDGDYIFVGKNGWGSQYSFVYKIDSGGTELWKTTHSFTQSNIRGFSVAETPDGGYLIAGSDPTNSQGELTVLLKLGSSGNIEWTQELTEEFAVKDLIIVSDGVILWGNADTDSKLIKTDLLGNIVWVNNYPDARAIKFVLTEDGGFGLLGSVSESFGNTDISLIRVNSGGEIIWENTYGSSSLDGAQDIKATEDNGFIMAGASYSNPDSIGVTYLVKVDSNGVAFPNLLHGTVHYDINENCAIDMDEPFLNEWIVAASNENSTLYGSTNDNGEYNISIPIGDYEISLIHPNDYWSACMDTVEVEITEQFDSVEVDFNVQSLEQCAFMVVSMNASSLKLCQENVYFVQCKNEGTVLAEDVFVEISFDDSLSVIDASVPYSLISGNTYSFTVGDVNFNEEENFIVRVFAPCEEEMLGQTLCAEAFIFPDTTCLPIDSIWTGASIEAKAFCNDNEVELRLKNVGTAPMQQALEYIVVEDDVIMISEPYGPLGVDDSFSYIDVADGTFYRIESEQEPNHPGMSMPSAFVEACGEGMNGEISLGFVNMFPMNDADPFVDIICLEAVAAVDPNDKVGLPLGYDEPNFIERGIDIEYTIRFQNTGTAAASVVRITDAISEHLEITSIRPAVSSHDYQFQLTSNGVAQFIFENINLPDSLSDPDGSIGFVTFKISQKADLPIGTEIFNEADIFFDFSSAVKTNETLHTIGENFITVDVGEILRPDLSLKVYPNPFEAMTTFKLEGDYSGNLNLEIYDAMGRVVRVDQFNGQQHQFYKNNLAAGIYFYSIKDKAGILNTGKLVVQ